MVWQRLPYAMVTITALLAVSIAVADNPSTTGPLVEISPTLAEACTTCTPGSATLRREKRHSEMTELRPIMHAELKAIPSLEKRMERLSAIQARRYELQKQRQAAVAVPLKNREDTVKQFHSLLREDARLSDQSRKIVTDIVGDMPRIQKQLDQRQAELKADLTKAESNASSPSTSELDPEATQDLRRRLRYVEFLERKLNDLKSHPERLDLLARVLRGVPFEESRKPADNRSWQPRHQKGKSGDKPATTESLRRRRKQLYQELQEIDRALDKIQRTSPHDTTSTKSPARR